MMMSELRIARGIFAAAFLANAIVGFGTRQARAQALELSAVGAQRGHVVLVAGGEEYRSEETMPMLAKILSQRNGFLCTVLFSFSQDGSYIDPNNQAGLRGFQALDSADLMIIGTRFRNLKEEEAVHLTRFMDAGNPIIGLRTATHAFRGDGKFGGKWGYEAWGRKILGEQWVGHHGLRPPRLSVGGWRRQAETRTER